MTEGLAGHGLVPWVAFNAFLAGCLALDFGFASGRHREIRLGEAIGWNVFWITLGLAFTGVVSWAYGRTAAAEYLTGYVVERALSIDNIFVFVVIFKYFGVPAGRQARVLFWGILGALGMRAAFILAGAALASRFHWVLYLFGAFLVIAIRNRQGVRRIARVGGATDHLDVRGLRGQRLLSEDRGGTVADLHGTSAVVRQMDGRHIGEGSARDGDGDLHRSVRRLARRARVGPVGRRRRVPVEEPEPVDEPEPPEAPGVEVAEGEEEDEGAGATPELEPLPPAAPGSTAAVATVPVEATCACPTCQPSTSTTADVTTPAATPRALTSRTSRGGCGGPARPAPRRRGARDRSRPAARRRRDPTGRAAGTRCAA